MDARISGPLLDCIDIHIEVLRVAYDKLRNSRLGEASAVIQARVEASRQRQRERFGVGAKQPVPGDPTRLSHASPVQCNAEIRPAEVQLGMEKRRELLSRITTVSSEKLCQLPFSCMIQSHLSLKIPLLVWLWFYTKIHTLFQ